jgi:hypothetical protein
MNCRAKCEILRNFYSCSAHYVKGLNLVTNTMVLLKNDNLALSNPNATSSLEARTPKTSSSVTNPSGSTLVLGYYK